MTKLVDVLVLGTNIFDVWVRVPSRAFKSIQKVYPRGNLNPRFLRERERSLASRRQGHFVQPKEILSIDSKKKIQEVKLKIIKLIK